jgi:hypothetical protein
MLSRAQCWSRRHSPRSESNRVSERLRPQSSRRRRNRKTHMFRRPRQTYGRVRCLNTWQAHQNATTVRTIAKYATSAMGFMKQAFAPHT